MNYLLWLTFFVWIPQLILIATNAKILWKYKGTLTLCIFWAMIFSVPWDWWATRTKIWLFPSDANIGVWFGGLPLEEYLFIVFVTLLISSITVICRTQLGNLLRVPTE